MSTTNTNEGEVVNKVGGGGGGDGGGVLVACLPPEIIVSILTSGFLWYDDLIRLSWCDKMLHRIVSTNMPMSRPDGIFSIGIRRAIAFHHAKEKSKEQGFTYMQAMTAAEVYFTSDDDDDDDNIENDNSWDQEFARATRVIGSTPYELEIHPDDDGEGFPLCNGEVKLCFGFIVHWQRLWEAVYPGRRWYKDERLLSQPLSEPPYNGQDGYTEIDTGTVQDDVSWDVWMGEKKCNAGETRPPGVKAWNGPYLKSHCAIADYVKRMEGFADNVRGLSVHYTGGAETGDFVMVGIQIGKNMSASYFDIFNATGRRLFSADRFGYDIIRASDHYAAATIGWDVDSIPFMNMTNNMADLTASVAHSLHNQRVGTSAVGYYFICNQW